MKISIKANRRKEITLTGVALTGLLLATFATYGDDKRVSPDNNGANAAESHKHEDAQHHHAFTNPVELAKKWNDPKRDKWQHPEEIIAALAPKPGATVADLGAGTGYMTAHLSKPVGKGGTVIAIDVEAAMIDFLAKRGSELGPAKIELRKVSADNPALQAASVDGVLTLDTWHHINHREAYAKKIYEALKQGGRFVLVETEINAEAGPPKAMRLEPEQVMKQLKSAGFRVETVRESMPRHYMIVAYKD